jgi:general stress protein 26
MNNESRIMTEEQKQKILKVLHENEFGVVATFPTEEDGSPESAVVAISQTPDLEIIFGSFSSSRKNANIKNNAKVSVVVGWDKHAKITVQVEGVAYLVTNTERSLLEAAHCIKNPESEKFKNDSRQEYFKIIPRWIRYSDFSKDPQEVWEIFL